MIARLSRQPWPAALSIIAAALSLTAGLFLQQIRLDLVAHRGDTAWFDRIHISLQATAWVAVSFAAAVIATLAFVLLVIGWRRQDRLTSVSKVFQ